MFRKGMKVAVFAACVMGLTVSISHAAPPALEGGLFGTFNGPPGPRPPPKIEGAALVETQAPGQPGPRPPPKLDGGSKGTTPPPK